MTALVQLLQAAVTLPTLVRGGYQSLWGIGIILFWVSGMRLVNMAHVAMAARGYLALPGHVMPPMPRRSDVLFAWIAFASGCASLIAFAGSVGKNLPQTYGVPFLSVMGSPTAQIIRISLALNILLFFLTRVAEKPRYMLAWAALWGVFSLAVASLA